MNARTSPKCGLVGRERGELLPNRGAHFCHCAAPSLTIQLTASNTVVVSWPSSLPGFVLQQNANGISSLSWSNVTEAIQDNSTNKTLFVDPTGGSRFYRLIQP